MLKKIRENYGIVIIPIFLVIGLIRRYQITSYELSNGKPTMSGTFVLYSSIFMGLLVTVLYLTLKSIHHSKMLKNFKILSTIIALAIGIPLVYFSLLFII